MTASMSNQNPITAQQIATAVANVERLDHDAKLRIVDRIFTDQPAVLGAVVQLHSLGVSYVTQEHALHVLLVLFECFNRVLPGLPRIAEESVQNALDNNAAMLRLLNEESDKSAEQLLRLSIKKYPEPGVLAFVGGYLNDNGFSTFSPENELVSRTCKSVMDVFVEARRSLDCQTQ